jgi:hypothetical protein
MFPWHEALSQVGEKDSNCVWPALPEETMNMFSAPLHSQTQFHTINVQHFGTTLLDFLSFLRKTCDFLLFFDAFLKVI